MKTVALSCTGEGFGHAARTVALAQMLRNSYRIVIFAPPHLFPFMNENLGNIALEKIPYFSFVKIRDRIDYARTVVSNLPQAIRFPAAVRRIARRLQAHQVDALISDYDPYGSYAADSLGMPILQINHPAVVLRQREFSLESLLAKIVSIVLMGKYHRKMVVSFYNGDVGPVVRKSLEEHRGPVEDFFVVYLKPSYRKIMLRALKRLAIHNVHVFPDPNKNIVDYLARCRGVISSAGHQFMSEALVLGKPVFVVPQTGQYEQLLNARMLELSGRGTWARIDELDTRLQEFVRNTDRYRTGSTPAHPHVSYRFHNDIDRVVRKIDAFIASTEGVATAPSLMEALVARFSAGGTNRPRRETPTRRRSILPAGL
ncbi:MAG: glycosyltransferase family protein [Alkalispirochaeta sp.]